MGEAIQWWFDKVVWPVSEKTGLDTWEAQCLVTGGPILWFALMGVGVAWYRMCKRKKLLRFS